MVIVIDFDVFSEKAIVSDGNLFSGAETATVIEEAVPYRDLRPRLHPDMEIIPEVHFLG